ncbi:cation diffusion facilitator family transporter [Lactobacillus delbrueckii]|uniref:cation diffusion facilitator family transporter n=1 Tax=Lactobacillus delbrueckii TaxID=1584 RepID=UPI001F428BAB|nr:cation diffusion facilitator family transporter [Lactobacillus delbrueckii]MCT2878040.1 cation transporter [Lactobacillus delbrueckii]MCT3491572.1 cation transporter [Lactobacillus delbrueckii]MDF4029618.1 cation diffusion facilitator family transporter [Lactobacillus delbrueckii]
MKDQASKRYLWVTVFNVIITAAEIAGGIISGSLALLSDALHNLSDVVSIVVAFAANLIAKRSKDQRKTFGYKRAETLAAYTNGLFLLAISIYLFISAIKRFSKPEPIEGGVMFIVSLIGLAGNLISMLILGKGSKENLNARALFLNMMSDTLSSVAVVVGSLLIYYQNWTLVDPVLTMAAAIFLLKEAFEVTRDSANVLMETNPDLDLEAIKEAALAFKEVRQLHHLHVWRYSDDTIMLDAHIVVDSGLTAKRIEELDEEIAACLKEKLAINHVTLQAECSRGLDEDLLSTNKEN